MDALVRWLTAQLDVDRAEAEKLADGDDYGLDASAMRWEETGEWNGYPYLRISKARVLREIEAQREVLRQHQRLIDISSDDPSGLTAMEAVIRSLAAVYADRPGYRKDWRP